MSKSRMTRGLLTAATLTVAALMVGCSSGAGTAANDTTPSTGSSEIDALIAEAKKEGSVSVYAVVDERMIQEVQRAFTDEYGIELSYMRATAAEISQRFSAEAEAGAPVADVVLTLDDGFLGDAAAAGTIQSLKDADIPGYPNELAAEAVLEDTAIVQLAQLALAYNTDAVDEMKDWEDLLDPALTGKVATASPDNGIYNALFYKLAEEYGDEFLEELGGQIGRVYSSGSQIIEALGSGEAHAVAGTLAAAIDIAQSQGAPVEAVVPETTLLAPTVMAMSAEAPHPAAARLLAYFLTTEAGQEVLNSGPGLAPATSSELLQASWIYDPALNDEARERGAEIKKLLGIQ